MKKTIMFLTALLVMAVLFASCSNGMGEKADGSGSASSQKVMVSFGIEFEGGVQRVINADDTLDGDLTYWYKATPAWPHQGGRPIAGDTNDEFLLIPSYTAGAERPIGYFTAGTWNIDVEVRKGETKIYSGSLPGYSIHTGHASIIIAVHPDSSAAVGTVNITVSVPTTGPDDDEESQGYGDYHESMVITYSGYYYNAQGQAQSTSGTAVIDDTDRNTTPGLTIYTTEELELKPGAYTFIFQYKDESVTPNGGAAMAVNVFAGENVDITGSIENGQWHAGSIVIKKPGFSSFSVTPSGPSVVAPLGSLQFTCSAESSSGNTITYAWYVNGAPAGVTDPQFTFNANAQVAKPYGLYEITCVAYDGDVAVKSNNVIDGANGVGRAYVQVAHPISKGTIEDGDITINKTYAAHNDIITLTLSPDGQKVLTDVKVNGSSVTFGVDASKEHAYIHLPNGVTASAEVTATFTAE